MRYFSVSFFSKRIKALSQYCSDFLLIALIIVAIVSPFLEQDYALNHSTHFNLSWAFQYQRQFLSGQLYPRWLEYSNFGFGNATFVFYPPLSLVATLPFAILNWSVSASLVGSMTIALMIFAIGFYGYAHCFFKRSTSLLLTIAALFNPYFLIDIYHRGAIAEVWGIVWIPWILWSTHQVLSEAATQANTLKRWLGIVILAVSYSLLMLSHLPTLLLFTLLWFILPWCSQPGHKIKGILDSYLGFGLALGLSSFYLLPAYLDQSLVQLQNLHPDADYYPQNRLLVTGLRRFLPKVSTHWFDQTIVPYALLVGVIAIVGFVAWFLEQDRGKPGLPFRSQGEVLWWCLTLGITIVMVTDLGAPIYALPVLAKIQFSWRWLSLSVVPVYLLLGYSYQVFGRLIQTKLLQSFRQTGQRSRFSAKVFQTLAQILTLSLTGLLGILLFVQANQILDQTEFNAELVHQFNTLSSQKSFPEEPHIPPPSPFLNWHIRFQDGLGLGDVYEYRAQAVRLPLPPPAPYPLVQWSDPEHSAGSITILDWDYGKRSFEVTNLTDQPQAITLRLLYYPGWHFHFRGTPWQPVFPSAEGLAEIPIPPGHHKAIVAYRGTGAERWGVRLSLLSGVILILSLIPKLGAG
ncbi:MAG: hypothetical protein ACO3NK_07130 [Prochlorotrichaceae cyanobacterium]